MGYFYLMIAIAGELMGTTALKASEGFTKIVPTAITLLCYGTCFLFLAKSLQYVPLSIAYATWSGVGVIAATLISVFLFKEGINTIGIIG